MPIKDRVTGAQYRRKKGNLPDMPASSIGESDEEVKEWAAIAKFVARGKGTAVKDKGKRILSVPDKLPKNNPKVHEIVVNGTRYAIVKIVTLG